ncbi:hypothetical protein SERLADRAFT_399608 [Serpula lacrymans var. lacrymans S7.9]|uniref:Uncharacterized protein n=1 Tax=Serpula lacrymans var. lacrymans (strain S7.9) TaxID=578457 RepID=F8P834_SERL9|nr:uncharacterized protein SERLADRAFT_399608 [Serpula lacrymans var. lacrymans S7.9]EGO20592.1 hypothetical protein SERLADRAFT_399608 [Serpula lacrymans var. lacrymans S7.9]
MIGVEELAILWIINSRGTRENSYQGVGANDKSMIKAMESPNLPSRTISPIGETSFGVRART